MFHLMVLFGGCGGPQLGLGLDKISSLCLCLRKTPLFGKWVCCYMAWQKWYIWSVHSKFFCRTKTVLELCQCAKRCLYVLVVVLHNCSRRICFSASCHLVAGIYL